MNLSNCQFITRKRRQMGYHWLPWFYVRANIFDNSSRIYCSSIACLKLRLIALCFTDDFWFQIRLPIILVSNYQIWPVARNYVSLWNRIMFGDLFLLLEYFCEKLSYILFWRFILGDPCSHDIVVKLLQLYRCLILLLHGHIYLTQVCAHIYWTSIPSSGLALHCKLWNLNTQLWC